MTNEIEEIVNLMLTSTDSNPYTGKLTTKNNILQAIALAEVCLGFATNGQEDEAMNIDVKDWVIVISELVDKL